MTNVLTDAEVTERLHAVPTWSRDGAAIVRTVDAPDFMTGIHWVATVAALAEDADHHPDIDIRYTSVTFRLSTHSEGGLTGKDFELAARIEAVVR